jgi:signal peptidase II
LKYFLLSLTIILIDQTMKLLIHFNLDLYDQIPVLGNWFILKYVLNPGMAFGMELGTEYGKLALSLFRLVFTIGLGAYLYILIKKKAKTGYLACIALIFGGALGNMIDSTFYGVFLENAPFGSVTPWFHGQVIDMLYFPMIEGYFPSWFPFWANEKFIFFRPVFNFADSAIFVGTLSIIVWQNAFFEGNKLKK